MIINQNSERQSSHFFSSFGGASFLAWPGKHARGLHGSTFVIDHLDLHAHDFLLTCKSQVCVVRCSLLHRFFSLVKICAFVLLQNVVHVHNVLLGMQTDSLPSHLPCIEL